MWRNPLWNNKDDKKKKTGKFQDFIIRFAI